MDALNGTKLAPSGLGIGFSNGWLPRAFAVAEGKRKAESGASALRLYCVRHWKYTAARRLTGIVQYHLLPGRAHHTVVLYAVRRNYRSLLPDRPCPGSYPSSEAWNGDNDLGFLGAVWAFPQIPRTCSQQVVRTRMMHWSLTTFIRLSCRYTCIAPCGFDLLRYGTLLVFTLTV
ncbi:hypothetical protein N658DRAFT_21755 [Parathielavia hyrcaniae]|uniref:Uncharacterized protein n=1 Tax=Parathielavia hyrcaniae TaxID=113614 RepID=A0AAN6T6Y2_9PEZI|nr:hypothetical protein N658DRAFT_21755 [Parathielavia hyrcaniae]